MRIYVVRRVRHITCAYEIEIQLFCRELISVGFVRYVCKYSFIICNQILLLLLFYVKIEVPGGENHKVPKKSSTTTLAKSYFVFFLPHMIRFGCIMRFFPLINCVMLWIYIHSLIIKNYVSQLNIEVIIF